MVLRHSRPNRDPGLRAKNPKILTLSAFSGKRFLASFRRGRLHRSPDRHPMTYRDFTRKLAALGYLPNRAIPP